MKKFKSILFACILALAVLALTACGNTAEEQDHTYDWALLMSAQSQAQSIISMSDEELDAYIEMFEYEQNVPLANGYNSWKSSKKELGEFIGFTDEAKVEYDKNGAPTITLGLEFEKRNCEFIIGLNRMWMNQNYTEITELTFNPEYTTGEKLGQAGTNLLIGMGTVFVVLIFLAWIISLFKYVHRAEEKSAKRKAEKEAAKLAASESEKKAEVQAPAEAKASVSPVPGMTITPAPADDELKAVIAAAVAAYEEDAGCSIKKQPSLNNGIVVKSIKRG